MPAPTTLAEATRIDQRKATKAYLDLIEDLRIIERIPAWTANRLNRVRDARHLAWFLDKIGAGFRRGIVLHTGSTTYPLGEHLWAMPIAGLT